MVAFPRYGRVRRKTLPDLMSILGLLAIAPLLIYAAYSDLRFLRIPNWVSLVMIAIFAFVVPSLSGAEFLSRVLLAAGIFGVGFVLFAANVLGAGDVKLLSALALFVPSGQSALFFLVLSGAMLLGLATITLLRARPPARLANWQSVATAGVFPMGISITLSGLVFLALSVAI